MTGLLTVWIFVLTLGEYNFESQGVADLWFFIIGNSGISEDCLGERQLGDWNSLAKVKVLEGSLEVLFDLNSGDVPMAWIDLKFWMCSLLSEISAYSLADTYRQLGN